jgi:WG repeat protein
MSFSSDGLAQAFIDGQWHYIKRNGDTLPVITYDNGADYFSEGLVRSIRNGKIAYYTADFAQAVPPRYDWGWPFENGRALVCRGCKKDETDKSEHIPVVGGEWGYIDRHGIEVVPVRLSQAEALSK